MASKENPLLIEMLELIRRNPGVRPKDLNRMLGRPHTASLRHNLIARSLVRKERDGAAVRYYAI
jgi:hypothetical protein